MASPVISSERIEVNAHLGLPLSILSMVAQTRSQVVGIALCTVPLLVQYGRFSLGMIPDPLSGAELCIPALLTLSWYAWQGYTTLASTYGMKFAATPSAFRYGATTRPWKGIEKLFSRAGLVFIKDTSLPDHYYVIPLYAFGNREESRRAYRQLQDWWRAAHAELTSIPHSHDAPMKVNTIIPWALVVLATYFLGLTEFSVIGWCIFFAGIFFLLKPMKRWWAYPCAISEYEAGGFQNALNWLLPLIEKRPPQHSGLFVLAALCHSSLRHDADAESCIKESVLIAPYDPNAWQAWAIIHARRSDWEKALQAVEEWLKIVPEEFSESALITKMAILSDSGNVEEALKVGAEVVKRFPHSTPVRMQWAWVLCYNADWNEALEAVRQCAGEVQTMPQSLRADSAKAAGLALLGLKRYDDAMKQLDYAKTTMPADPAALNLVASCLALQGKFAEAKSALADSVRLDGVRGDTKFMQAMLQSLERGDDASSMTPEVQSLTRAAYFDSIFGLKQISAEPNFDTLIPAHHAAELEN